MEFENILNNCYQLQIDKNNLKAELVEMFDQYCKSRSLQFENIFTPFLTICSGLCGQSSISITKEFNQPFSLFAILALTPSKTSSLPLLKSALEAALFNFNQCNQTETDNVLIHDLKINNFDDQLINELSKNKTLVHFHDNMSILNNKTENYFEPKSLLLKLYEGVSKHEHSLKSSTQITIEKPRVAILIEESATRLIETLNKEKIKSNENLICYETIICCPKQNRISLNQLIPFDYHINLVHLFFAIKTLHKNNNRCYEFDRESLTKLSLVIETYNRICEANEIDDQSISKASYQFIRIIAILHVIDYTIDILKNIPNLKETTFNRLHEILLKNKESKTQKTISATQVSRSIQINNYFLQNKICLFGYQLDNIDIFPEINLATEKTIKLSRNESLAISEHVINLTPRLPSLIIEKQAFQSKIRYASSNDILLHDTMFKDTNKQTEKRSKSYLFPHTNGIIDTKVKSATFLVNQKTKLI